MFLKKFQLPYPPSVNNYWGSTGRIYMKTVGTEFRKKVQEIAGTENPIEGKVHLEVWLYPPDRRRRDIDNPMKSLMDALEHAGVFRDDVQVMKLTVLKMEKFAGGKTHVRISEFEGYEEP